MARILKFLDGALHPAPLSSNCDLWRPLWQMLQLVKGRVTVRKVPAHDDPDQALDVVHEWAVRQNDAADASAKRANLARPAGFWEVWNAVRIQHNSETLRADRIMALHAAVGHKASRNKGNHHP